MQSNFGTIAVGQGALRLEVVPALRKQGLTLAQIERRFPDLTRAQRGAGSRSSTT